MAAGDFKTFRLTTATGAPKADALTNGLAFTDYRTRGGVPRTQPQITYLGAGVYGFVPSPSDTAEGIAYAIYSGSNAYPARHFGAIHEDAEPFAAFLLTNQSDGGLWAGAAPTVDLYVDPAGVARTPPALNSVGVPHLFTLTPTASDLAVGVTGTLAMPTGADPSPAPSFSFSSSGPAPVISITKQSLLDRFPELGEEPSLSEFVWAELLSDVAMEIYVPSWLNQDAADRAAVWLLAHFVALEKKRLQNGLAGATGPGQLKSITVGPVTKTWETSAAGSSETKGEYSEDSMLERTEYGREYMRLRKRLCRLRKR